jgi:hypothetical protein
MIRVERRIETEYTSSGCFFIDCSARFFGRDVHLLQTGMCYCESDCTADVTPYRLGVIWPCIQPLVRHIQKYLKYTL